MLSQNYTIPRTVWRRYNQWSGRGVFRKSYHCILQASAQKNTLDLSVVNGDGTNTITKKGGIAEDILDINIKMGLNE
jgi:hypothetical protein